MKRLLILSLLLGLSCASKGRPPQRLDSIIYTEWNIAQRNLDCLGYKVNSYNPSIYRWVKHSSPFKCGGVLSNGCYSSFNRTISWNTKTPNVIRHEAGHVMLRMSGATNWRCYEHSDRKGCPIELQQPWKCLEGRN